MVAEHGFGSNLLREGRLTDLGTKDHRSIHPTHVLPHISTVPSLVHLVISQPQSTRRFLLKSQHRLCPFPPPPPFPPFLSLSFSFSLSLTCTHANPYHNKRKSLSHECPSILAAIAMLAFTLPCASILGVSWHATRTTPCSHCHTCLTSSLSPYPPYDSFRNDSPPLPPAPLSTLALPTPMPTHASRPRSPSPSYPPASGYVLELLLTLESLTSLAICLSCCMQATQHVQVCECM